MTEILTVVQGLGDDQEAMLDALTSYNADIPPAFFAPSTLGNFRHKCEARGGVSKPIDLKEVYAVNTTGNLALIYKEGTCKFCKETARSREGRVVRTAERPPLMGKVAR